MNRFGSRGSHGGGNMTPPVEVGEEIDVTIEAVGEKGDGIAKKNGFVLFVPNVKEGQRVRIKITKVLRKVGFAEVVGEAQTASEETAETSEEPAEEDRYSEPAPAEEDSEDFGEESENFEEDSENAGIESTQEEDEDKQ